MMKRRNKSLALLNCQTHGMKGNLTSTLTDVSTVLITSSTHGILRMSISRCSMR
jgi:hypothetical protein